MDTEVSTSIQNPVSAKETPFPAMGEKWMSPHTLAQRLGCHRETVLRLIRRGDLPALRINRRVYRIREYDARQYFVGRIQ